MNKKSDEILPIRLAGSITFGPSARLAAPKPVNLSLVQGGNIEMGFKNFEEALAAKLEIGLSVEAAIQAAVQENPALYQEYCRGMAPISDPTSADQVIARKARELAMAEGIDLDEATVRVCSDPANRPLVENWKKTSFGL